MKNTAETLASLVLNDRCLLHGSPKKTHQLFPHFTDGEMAICATPYHQVAIFMAIVKSLPYGESGYTAHYKKENKKVRMWAEFTICDGILEKLLHNDLQAYVYALDSGFFTKNVRNGFVEHRTYDPVLPLKTIPVEKSNLPFTPHEGQNSYPVLLNPMFAAVFN